VQRSMWEAASLIDCLALFILRTEVGELYFLDLFVLPIFTSLCDRDGMIGKKLTTFIFRT
jgi:hypothetical protein